MLYQQTTFSKIIIFNRLYSLPRLKRIRAYSNQSPRVCGQGWCQEGIARANWLARRRFHGGEGRLA